MQMAAMDIGTANDACGKVPQSNGKRIQPLAMGAAAMEHSEAAGITNDATAPGECSASASSTLDAHHKTSFLGDVATTFEPLKVGLDDDSSIDDSDDDMFDDDAFTFGDEDFAALMSHETMKRMSVSIKSQTPPSRAAVPSTATIAAPNSMLPLHHTASLLSDKSSCGADPGIDSLPTTAASSTGEFHLHRA